MSLGGKCVPCSQNCKTCVNKPDSCLSCSESKYLYDFSCLAECPSGYEDMQNQCVVKGLRCPFGHIVNPTGSGCILSAKVCDGDFLLNLSKDRCIPLPGNYVPFPLLITSGFMLVIILGSWIITRKTQIVTNLIGTLSFIETIGILSQLVLSYQMGIFSTFGLTIVAAFFLYGTNLFFCMIFLKQVT